MKLIDAYALINHIVKKYGLIEVILDIDEMPAIDAEPVKHGHWVKKEHAYSSDSGIYRYECSLCHCSDEHNESRDVPYCWNCGARMDEEEDEDEGN